MKTSFKKFLSIFLAALMLVSVVSVMGVSAAETGKAKTGGYTVVLDASNSGVDAVEWKAWTWADGSDGYWAEAHGTNNSDITFDSLEKNIIFACFQWGTGTPDAFWTGKIAQSGNMTVDGSLFTVTSASGSVQGSWSGTPTEGGSGGGEQGGGEQGGYNPGPGQGPHTVVLDASGVDTGYVDWRAWTWADDSEGYWVGAEGTTAADITYTGLEDNVVFAYFTAGSGDGWEGKIGQTTDLRVEGTTFTVFTAEAGDGGVTGEWSGEIDVPTDPEPTTTPEPITDPEPTTTPEPSETVAPTTAVPVTQPVTAAPETTPFPTDPTSADENENLYVSAKSNLDTTGSRVKINGNTVTVTYYLKSFEKLDDGEFTVYYDSSKLNLSPTYNTKDSMFTVIKGATYNLNYAPSTAKFNFSGTNGAFDFTNGGVLVNLVFTRKSSTTAGTAYVYLNMIDLDSKNTNYVDNSVIKNDNVEISQVISEVAVTEPKDADVATDAAPNLVINASSNISDEVQKIVCDKAHAKVTYRMTLADLLAYGKGVVTYDGSKLALEAKYNNQSSMFTTLNTQTIYNLNAASDTMMFSFTSVDPETQTGTYDFRGGGDVISLTFTVKAGATGEADVYLDLMDLGSISTDYISGGTKAPAADNIISNIVIAPEVPTTSATQEPTIPIATETSDTDPTPDPYATTAPEATTNPVVEPTTAPVTTAPATQTPTVAPQPVKPTQAPTIAPSKVNFSKNPDEKSAINALAKAKSDADPKGSVFNKLKAKVSKTTKKSNKLTWNKVKGAKKYIVMGNKCGKTNGKFNAFKKLKTTTGKSFTQKDLKKGTYYKYVVLAVNSKGKVISASKVIHVATKGGKVTNYKSLKVKKAKFTLKKGKTAKIKITKKVKMTKGKVKNHRKIKYESANTKIATVSASGKIKAKKKGTTYVYAYAQNGVFKKIKVKVK